jgi:hypothetical protein
VLSVLALGPTRRSDQGCTCLTDDKRTAVAEVCGACPRCPTDFAVQTSPDCVELHIWQDLGPEGSPKPCVDGPGLGSASTYRNVMRGGLTLLHHEPGSVRALYTGAGENLEHPLLTDSERENG